MKKNSYFKVRLARTDEEILFNTFPMYVIGVIELLMIIILEGEFNYISIISLILCAVIACVAAYKIGLNSGR